MHPRVPGDWTTESFYSLTYSLPPGCREEPDPGFPHGGQRWKCGAIGASVVWGMWGADSFEDSSVKCRAEVARVSAMVVRHQVAGGSHVAVWYRTGEIHEPIVSAWSERPEDAALVEAIAFSGRTSPAGRP